MWFRQDLRLHDNESLHQALEQTDETYYIYVFDRRIFEEKTSHGFSKMGSQRAFFLRESVRDLRNRIRARGAELIIRYGYPEEKIFELAQEFKPSWVFCNRERMPHDVYVQDALEYNLWSIGCEMRYARGKMLYYTLDLPFPITHTPEQFNHFRKEVDRYVPIRQPLDSLKHLPSAADLPIAGDLPDDETLGIIEPVDWLPAGESGALHYLRSVTSGESRPTHESKAHILPDKQESFIVSPYLAHGCLSPKMLYHTFAELSSEIDNTLRMKKLLQLRDFLRLLGKKNRSSLFSFKGFSKAKEGPSRESDHRVVNAWMQGETDFPLINALMLALRTEGYIPYKGRELVASFLVHYLKQDWTIGAEYFEQMLIDYDPCSNWANWQYIAGVGTSSLDIRSLDYHGKSKRLDPYSSYTDAWLANPEQNPISELYQ